MSKHGEQKQEKSKESSLEEKKIDMKFPSIVYTNINIELNKAETMDRTCIWDIVLHTHFFAQKV